MTEEEVLLRIEDLKTYFHTYEGVVKALEGINIDVRKGETMGLVGETGCGKSVTALTVMGLIPSPPGKVESGGVFLGEPAKVTALRKEYDKEFKKSPQDRQKEIDSIEKQIEALVGEANKPKRMELRDRLAALTRSYDLITKSQTELNEVRGARMSMVFQEPMTALNPAYTIGDQIGETLELHQLDKLIEDVLKQLELEMKAFEARKVARRNKKELAEFAAATAITDMKSTREVEVCSICGTRTREDWRACVGCGARLSPKLPRPVRKMFYRIALRYYNSMKENPQNSWAYFVKSNPVTIKLQRRLKLAKTIRAEDALRDVKIAEPGRIVRSYPFELSGGMKQRAMIAMMMSCQPELLIADEPTTALDVTVEAQILALMRELQMTKNTSILLITHDLGVIAEVTNRVAVMYAGYVAELSTTKEIFARPTHPYTHALLRSIPKIGLSHMKERKKPLYVIPGIVPNLLKPPPGCRFHPRCERALEVCKRVMPDLIEHVPGHFVACHNPVPFGPEVKRS